MQCPNVTVNLVAVAQVQRLEVKVLQHTKVASNLMASVEREVHDTSGHVFETSCDLDTSTKVDALVVIMAAVGVVVVVATAVARRGGSGGR